MHPLVLTQLMVLLMLANGTPVVAKKLLGERCSHPLDGSVNFVDGLDGLLAGISLIAVATLGINSLTADPIQPVVAMLCALLAGSLLGFLFWTLGARHYSQEAVGLNFVLISGMNFWISAPDETNISSKLACLATEVSRETTWVCRQRLRWTV